MSGYVYVPNPWILRPQEDSTQKEQCITLGVEARITCLTLGDPKQNTKRQCHLVSRCNLTTAMSSRSPLKVAVEAAEEELKRHIGLTTSTDLPYYLLTKGLKCVEDVIDRWLEDRTNLERIEAQTGKTFKPNPRENVVDAFPVVFTNTPRSGFLHGRFPNKYLVIMAIGGLDRDNGAAATGREKLESGDYVVLPGHQHLWFNSKGGGVAVFVVVDMGI